MARETSFHGRHRIDRVRPPMKARSLPAVRAADIALREPGIDRRRVDALYLGNLVWPPDRCGKF